MTTLTSKQITNTLLIMTTMIAIASSGVTLHTPSVAIAQESSVVDMTCIDKTTQDIDAKSESFDAQRAKNAADNSDQLREAVDNDQYKFDTVSYTWNNNFTDCAAQLKDALVQYTATNEKGKDRLIVIVINPDYTVNRSIVQETIFSHATGTSPIWGGHVIKGNSTEATSKVYRATLNWLIPTPNDPAQLNCGTSGASQCVISVWTGLSQTDAGNNMVQLGTDSICSGNNCSSGRSYAGWLETVPGGTTFIMCFKHLCCK